MTPEDLRNLAFAFPETAEADHHGISSLRVRGRIFATLPDEDHVRVMAGDEEILAAVARDPETYSPFWWGKRLACVVVDLRRADATALRELIDDAWRRKAPASLAKAWQEEAGGS